MNKNKLNIVFHKITKCPKGDWEVTPSYFFKIFNWCKKNYSDFSVYFDDGEKMDFSVQEMATIAPFSILSVVTNLVGKTNHYGWKDLSVLVKKGFKVASHGASHVSLAKYDNSDKYIMKCPKGGTYEDHIQGKYLLSEQQIRYQLAESWVSLFNHGFKVDEFVFPYGLYSKQVLKVAEKIGRYNYYATCDDGVYTGGKIIPRFLIYGAKTAEDNIKCLSKIIQR
jgi:hypothetical protein